MIISVKEARKLLGKDAGELSDQQIVELLEDLTILARLQLKNFSVRKSKSALRL